MSWNISASVSSVPKLWLVEDRLHLRGEPVALGLVGDADEFHAERAAIGQAQFFDQVAQRAVGFAEKSAATNLAIQVA